MQLTDILKPDCVKVPLDGASKPEVIEELLALLAAAGRLQESYAAVRQAVFDREAIRSTGVGQGFALPHGKTPAITTMSLAIGRTAEPIGFDAIDGQPVSIVVLLVSPAQQTGQHIQALAHISRIMTDKGLRPRLWAASTAAALYKLLESYAPGA